ncbi:MAG: MGMT family protein [Candidatus Syntropharchaeia archaeon]
MKKSWREKIEADKGFPKFLEFGPKVGPCRKTLEKWGAKPGDRVVIASHSEVEGLISKIPRGKLVTIKELCEGLARIYGVDFCCPLVAGISVWLISNAAEEEAEKLGKEKVPYWRVLKTGGYLNEKYPGGAERQKELLEEEGHAVVKKGKRWFVEDFEKSLFSF